MYNTVYLVALFPLGTAGQNRSAGYTGGRVNIHAVRVPGRVFFKFNMGKAVKVYYWWMVRFEPTTPNHMVPADDAIY